jgi:hypothetical protein
MGNLHNGHTVGATGMKAEHFKEWLVDIKRKETEDGVEGIGAVGGHLWLCCKRFGRPNPSQLR